MHWTRSIDGYCERLGPEYWAEPANAVTNAAFLLAAGLMWGRVQGPGLGLARLMTGVLALIGVGSFLFHTHATVWASLADVLPILGFVLVYLYAANRHYLGLRRRTSWLLLAMFFPYAFALLPVFALLPLGSSASYGPIPLLIFLYALVLRRRLPQVARGLALGAGLLVVSLTFRTVDEPLCGALPLGTHFLWHILNAVMLGWMIEVYRRHMLASRDPEE